MRKVLTSPILPKYLKNPCSIRDHEVSKQLIVAYHFEEEQNEEVYDIHVQIWLFKIQANQEAPEHYI